MNITLPRFTSRAVSACALLFMSMLLAVSVPVATVNAQAAAETQAVKELKQKVLKEIDRRLENFEKTRKSLSIDIHISSNGTTFQVKGLNDKDTTKNKDTLPSEFKDKVKKFIEKVIEQLKAMQEKVTNTMSLGDLKSLAKNIDAQFQITQLTDVQAAVTKAIESLSGVFDKLKKTAGGLQSQIAKIRKCLSGNTDKSTCVDLNLNGEGVVTSAQSQLDNISTMMTTIGSILASSITLVMALVATFSGMMGGLGGLGSLGNLGNLGNISDLSGMLGGLGGLSGLMGSFSAITSQIGIANGMAGNASGLLGSLTSFINLPI